MSLLDEARQVLGTRGTLRPSTEHLPKPCAIKLRRLTEMVFDVDNDEIEAWSEPD
jgi:hypothetical protein